MSRKKIGILLAAALAAVGAVAVALAVLLPGTRTPGHGNIDEIDWYDVNGTEFVIEDIDMLYDVVTLSYHYDFAGQTLKLGADITVNRGEAADWEKKAPAIFWAPIRNFAGTFDGQGHTISGLYAKTDSEPTALFSYVQSDAVIRDLRLENSLFLTAGRLGSASIAAQCAGTYQRLYSNAIVRCDYGVAGGLFSRQTGKLLAEECWFDGVVKTGHRNVGGIADQADAAEMVLNHCLNTGTIMDTWRSGANYAGGLVGNAVNSARLVINDCFSGGRIEVGSEYGVGSVLGGGDSTSNTTIINTFCSLDTFELPVSEQITNLSGGAVPIVEKDLLGTGAYRWTDLDFANYWACRDGELPMLQCFAKGDAQDLDGVVRAVDYDWYDETADELTITNAEQLYAFTLLSYNTDYSSKKIKLAADITLNEGTAADWVEKAPEHRWYPVQWFAGTFDGQGHTISGLYVIGNNAQGMFSRTKGTGALRNFRLVNSLIHAKAAGLINTNFAMSGAIVGRGGGTYDSIYTDAIVYAEGSQIGGIIGQVNLKGMITTISNCWFDGKLITVGAENGYTAGGIVGGHVLGTVNMSHCLYTGTIRTEAKRGSRVGGFVGVMMNDSIINIGDSLSAGVFDTASPYVVGGAVGVAGKGNTVNISDSYAVKESVENNYGEYVSHNKGAEEAQIKGGAIPVYRKYLTGKSAYSWTSLNFTKYWSLRSDGIPVPTVFYGGEAISTAGMNKVFNFDWYEADKGGTIRSTADYIGFTMLSWTTNFADQTVRLGADVTLNTGDAAGWGKAAPAIQSIPMQEFAGTFDGQGHTISGVYERGKALLGLFAKTAKTATVRNFRLVNSFFDVLGVENEESGLLGFSGSIVGRGGGTLDTIYSSAILRAYGYENGGMIGQVNVDAANRFTNLWFDGSIHGVGEKYGYFAGGIAGAIVQGSNQLAHCLFTGIIETDVSDKGSKVGGIIGALSNTATASVTDSLSAGTLQCGNPYYKGAILGAMYAKNKLTITNCFADSASALDKSGQFVSAARHADTPDASLSDGTIPVSTANLTGLRGYQWTTLDFDKYWAPRQGACPGLKSFVSKPLSTASTQKLLDLSWYDASAKTLTIASVAELYGLYVMSFSDDFSGKTVKLGADIAVNSGDASTWGAAAPANSWTPIGTFSGTFDGQGHTISGIYVKVASGNDLGFISTLKGGTVKNLRLTNSYIEGGAESRGVGGVIGTVDGGGAIEKVYCSATVVHSSYNNGGLAGRATNAGTLTITGSQFDGTVTGTGYNSAGILGAAVHDTTVVQITNCLMSGAVTTDKMRAAGGVLGNRMNGSTVTVSDTLVSGTVETGGGGQTGAIAGIINGKGTLTLTNVYATAESCTKGSAGVGAGTPVGAVETFPAAKLTGVGGYKKTVLDFDTYWSAVETGTPVLTAFYTGAAIDLTDVDRNAPDVEPIVADVEIGTAAELAAFAAASQSDTYAGKLIVLTADIDMTGIDNFPMIGSGTKVFAGTFDGQGHTISHLSVTGVTTQCAGLFREVSGTVQNLTIADSTFSSSTYFVGAAVGRLVNGGVVDGVTVTNTAISGDQQAGGVVGKVGANGTANVCAIENCVVTGGSTVTTAGANGRAGGILGQNQANVTISGCTVDDCTVSTNGSGPRAGGILGYATGTSIGDITITDCYVGATVQSAGGRAGGILGFTDAHLITLKLDGCVFTGTAGKAGTYCNGGLLGQLQNTGNLTVVLEDCVAAGTVLGGNSGSLIGVYSNASPLTITRCCYTGSKWKTMTGTPTETDLQTVELSNAAELMNVARASKTFDFSGVTLKLTEDIDLNPGWTVGTEAPKVIWPMITSFAGTLDGQNHTVSGVYIPVSSGTEPAFIAVIPGGAVQNLTLANSCIAGEGDPVSIDGPVGTP